MKWTTIIIFIVFLVSQAEAQFIIIGDSDLEEVKLPKNDTSFLHEPPNSSDYYDFDIDRDGVKDISFYLYVVHAGPGYSWVTNLYSYNDFSIHLDTNYIEHIEYYTFGGVRDTTRKVSVARKYNLGDTIYGHKNSLGAKAPLYRYSVSYEPRRTTDNIDLFLDDTSYIAIENNNGDLYYFKIKVTGHGVSLYYGKTNAYSVNTLEHEVQQNYIFPNPASETLNIKSNFKSVKIFSAQGALLIEKNKLNSNNVIDISHLKSGMYIVLIKSNDDRMITTTLIKI